MDTNVAGVLLELKETTGELCGKVDVLTDLMRQEREERLAAGKRLGKLEGTVSRMLGYAAGVSGAVAVLAHFLLG